MPNILKIAEVCGVSVDWLIEEYGGDPSGQLLLSESLLHDYPSFRAHLQKICGGGAKKDHGGPGHSAEKNGTTG